MFIGDVGCSVAINVFEPRALNPKFQHFVPIFLKKYYFTIVSLELENGLRNERRAPRGIKVRSLYEKFQ